MPDVNFKNAQIAAPWTAQQVNALNDHQRDGRKHPYTCATDHQPDRNLWATTNGWVCLHCGYRQNWAWRAHAEPQVAVR